VDPCAEPLLVQLSGSNMLGPSAADGPFITWQQSGGDHHQAMATASPSPAGVNMPGGAMLDPAQLQTMMLLYGIPLQATGGVAALMPGIGSPWPMCNNPCAGGMDYAPHAGQMLLQTENARDEAHSGKTRSLAGKKGGGKGGGKVGGKASSGKANVKLSGKRSPEKRVNSGALAKKEEPDLSTPELLKQVQEEGSSTTVSLSQALPFMMDFVKDQIGSRFVQSALSKATGDEREEAFVLIKDEAAELAGHVYANFVIQKFLEIGTVDQRKELVHKMWPEVLNLANDIYGCRVIQKAIESVPRESQQNMSQKLQEDVMSCIDSMHGNHVIQTCIEQMPPDSVNFIVLAVEADPVRVACHMYGCRVVQRLLEHCASQQLQHLLDSLAASIDFLTADLYGNYVVQHMLEHGRLEDKREIVRAVARNVDSLWRSKCSSHVVEKALEIASEGQHSGSLEAERSALVSKLIGDPSDRSSILHQMVGDRFGTFIVQRLIEHTQGHEKEILKQALQRCVPLLKRHPRGKYILDALKRAAMS